MKSVEETLFYLSGHLLSIFHQLLHLFLTLHAFHLHAARLETSAKNHPTKAEF